MKNFLILILLLLEYIHSEISLETIQRANQKILPKELEHTIINPLIGSLALKCHFISNFRFFNTSTNFSINNSGERNYDSDIGTTGLSQAFIKLFPSPAGILTTHRNKPSNFTRKYFQKSNIERNIEKLAKLVVKIYNENTEISTENNIENELKELLLLDSNKSIDNIKELKIILIHSYIIKVLDRYEDYLIYLSKLVHLLKDIRTKNDININTTSDSNIIPEYTTESEMNEFKNLYKDTISSFPYSKYNLPEANIILGAYNRKSDSFSNHILFSDCVDITILHLCNCIFWDKSTKSYNLEYLKLDENAPLSIFYNKYGNNMFPLTREKRNDWSKVVQDLDNNLFQCNSTYNPHIVEYIKNDCRNELQLGIINTMSILVRICSSSNNKILKDYNELFKNNYVSVHNIHEIFVEFLNILANPKNIKINLISAEKKFTFEGIERADFIGHITMEVVTNLNLVSSEVIQVKINERHAELAFIPKNNNKNEDIINNFKNLINNENITVFKLIIKTYINFLAGKNIGYIEEDHNIKNLCFFCQGQLYKSDQKRVYLLELAKILSNDDITKDFELEIIKVCENVIRSAILSDPGTKELFIPFFYLSKNLISTLSDKEKINAWSSIYSKYQEIDLCIIKNGWINIIKNIKNNVHLSIKQNLHTVNSSLEMIIIAIQSLKTLKLEYYNNNIFYEKIFPVLSEIHSLELLDFSGNRISDRNIQLFINTLDGNSISHSLMQPSSTSSSLISSNNTQDIIRLSDGNINNSSLLKSPNKKWNLKALDLSLNRLNYRNAKLIADGLKRNLDLVSLNLAFNRLKYDDIIYFITVFSKDTTLKHLNLTGNRLNELDVINIKNYVVLINYNIRLEFLNYRMSTIYEYSKYLE